MWHESSAVSSLIGEIIEGKSKISDEYFLKHFTIKQFNSLNIKKAEIYENAIFRGIKSEERLLADAKKDGVWTQSDYDTFKSLKDDIQKYQKLHDKTEDYITRQQFKGRVEFLKEQLKDLDNRYQEIVSVSAESYCEQKSSFYLIQNSVYRSDEKQLDYEEIQKVAPQFFDTFNKLMDYEMLVKAAYNNIFFEVFIIHEKSPHLIFDRNGFDMTIFQKNIIHLARNILSKLKNCYDMPDDIKDDPMAILKYDPEKNKKKNGMEDIKGKMSKGINMREAIAQANKK